MTSLYIIIFAIGSMVETLEALWGKLVDAYCVGLACDVARP